MSNEIDDLSAQLRASLCVQQHLLLALFDAIGDKDTAIKQFQAVTEMTEVHVLYSDESEHFYQMFQNQREVLLCLLNDSLGKRPRSGGG